MHPPRMRQTQHDAGVGAFVVKQQLESGGARFTIFRNLANSNFVTDHFDRLYALDFFARQTGVNRIQLVERTKINKTEITRHLPDPPPHFSKVFPPKTGEGGEGGGG